MLLAREYEDTGKSSSPPSPPLARSAKLRQEKRFLVWGDSGHALKRVERDSRASRIRPASGEPAESAFGLAGNDNDPAPAVSYAKAALIGRLALTAVLIAC
jgi:hypothetical protein